MITIRRRRKQSSWGLPRLLMLLALGLVLLGVGGMLYEYRDTLRLPAWQQLLPMRFSPPNPHSRTHYQEGVSALSQQRPQDALDAFSRMDRDNNRLRHVALLHEAEAYALLGQEGKAQKALQRVLQEAPSVTLRLIAQYELGQSFVRSREVDKAQPAFEAVLATAPESNLALGSHYYLGQLAQTDHQPEQARSHWRTYLTQAPNGTFSRLAAEGLLALGGNTPTDHALLGQMFYHQQQWQEAFGHFKQAPIETVWLPMGQTAEKLQMRPQAEHYWQKGLAMAGSRPDDTDTAIVAILNHYPDRGQKRAKLEQLLHLPVSVGQDSVLNQLFKLSADQAKAMYAQQLIQRFPKSRWAPEASWSLLWPHYTAGHDVAFLHQADYHMKTFPTSLSAPRVLFWKAKYFLRKGKPEVARRLLQDLTGRYPHQYYAFRAQQLLAQDASPWQTDVTQTLPEAVPPQHLAKTLLQTLEDRDFADVLGELAAMDSGKEMLWLLGAYYGNAIPAPLESLALGLDAQYARSIRIVRDYLDNQRKAGRPVTDSTLLHLLYPIRYPDLIERFSRQNHLDPVLVLALTRQESYFNPLAVSSSRAMGLMQLLPSTAQGVAKTEALSGFTPATLFNPEINVRLGCRYLRYLHERFQGNSMQSVGGYNWGPGAMSRFTAKSAHFRQDPDMFIETIPATEARNYIKEVFAHYWNYQRLYALETAPAGA